MVEVIKAVTASVIGGAIAYGYMKAEVNQIKETIKMQSNYGERLASMEAKLDILLKHKA